MGNEDACGGPLQRPVMQGMLARKTKILLVRTLLVSVITGMAFKYGYIERKKNIYRNFYENYDIDKEFERMREKNVFDSC